MKIVKMRKYVEPKSAKSAKSPEPKLFRDPGPNQNSVKAKASFGIKILGREYLQPKD